LVHTGQHWDFGMSDVFFDQMRIDRPDVNMGVGSGTHGEQTAKMLQGLEAVIAGEKPDWVVVMGDTNSTLAGAIAAAKLNVPLAHVEAGLRSFNRRMPEEVNRVLTDHASNLLFAPTRAAVDNLIREGIAPAKVSFVGDVMYDSFVRFSKLSEEKWAIARDLGVDKQSYVLATIHRAENTDDHKRLRSIVAGLAKVAESMPVLLPLHPRTKASLANAGLSTSALGAVKVIDPLGYLEMLAMEKHAAVIASDSGGVQKEAYFARVPCVTLRDETEWIELVELGWNRLCPPANEQRVAETILAAVGSKGRGSDLYGGGKAAERIASELAKAP